MQTLASHGRVISAAPPWVSPGLLDVELRGFFLVFFFLPFLTLALFA